MCVIAIISKTRPKPEAVEKMYNQNSHGGGVAWREKGLVKWKKGLNLEQMQDLIKNLPTPFIAHFRIASAGAQIKELCHPFPVSIKAQLDLEGETKGYVLFHNGHWSQWKDFTKETALKMGRALPIGPWSDTRALAWHAHNYGLGILEMIDEKVVAFGPTDLEVLRGRDGWDEVDGVWCSNKYWNASYSGGFGGKHRGATHEGIAGFFSRGARDQSDDDSYYKKAPASLAGGKPLGCLWTKDGVDCRLTRAHHGPHDYTPPDGNKSEAEQCVVTLNGKHQCRLPKNHTGGHNYVEAAGGGLDEIPFDLIEETWKEQQEKPRSEWTLSKKQFKRLKRKHEGRLRRLGISKRGKILRPAVVH